MSERTGHEGLLRLHMSAEEARYTAVLRAGVRVVLAVFVVVWGVYGLEILSPSVPLDDLPQYWGLSAAEYVERTGVPMGWQWLGRLGEGDVLTIVPAVAMSGLTAVCLAAVLPLFVRRREYTHVIVIVLHLAVIVWAAASGR
jgi:hypothetical protein